MDASSNPVRSNSSTHNNSKKHPYAAPKRPLINANAHEATFLANPELATSSILTVAPLTCQAMASDSITIRNRFAYNSMSHPSEHITPLSNFNQFSKFVAVFKNLIDVCKNIDFHTLNYASFNSPPASHNIGTTTDVSNASDLHDLALSQPFNRF